MSACVTPMFFGFVHICHASVGSDHKQLAQPVVHVCLPTRVESSTSVALSWPLPGDLVLILRGIGLRLQSGSGRKAWDQLRRCQRLPRPHRKSNASQSADATIVAVRLPFGNVNGSVCSMRRLKWPN